MEGRKRLNPDTGKEFNKGDVRPSTEKQDGKKFKRYRFSRVKKNGFYEEEWQSQLAADKDKSRRAKYKKESRAKLIEITKKNPFPRRTNPNTGKVFKLGDCINGKYFIGYVPENSVTTGYLKEYWAKDKNAFNKYKIGQNLKKIKKRAFENLILFNLTAEYMFDLFPKDSRCPILGIEMKWGNDNRASTPSVDRIVPDKGYVKGNVVWISHRANRLKSNASLDELKKLNSFYNDK